VAHFLQRDMTLVTRKIFRMTAASLSLHPLHTALPTILFLLATLIKALILKEQTTRPVTEMVLTLDLPIALQPFWALADFSLSQS
jgi:hypothetical protein